MTGAAGADVGGRRVTRTNLATGEAITLAGRFQGRPFNSPNDITIDERGRIYFSDPRYTGDEPVEQAVQGVYRIDPNGRVSRIIVDASKPNGVLVAPNQRTLYVAVNDQGVEDEQRLTPRELGQVKNVDQSIYAPTHCGGTARSAPTADRELAAGGRSRRHGGRSPGQPLRGGPRQAGAGHLRVFTARASARPHPHGPRPTDQRRLRPR